MNKITLPISLMVKLEPEVTKLSKLPRKEKKKLKKKLNKLVSNTLKNMVEYETNT